MPLDSPMRHQGEVVEWSAEKKCGFIRPRGASERDPLVFVSASSFRSRSKVPEVGDILTYERVELPDTEQNRRLRTMLRAQNARFLDEEEPGVTPPADGKVMPILAAAYLVGLMAGAAVTKVALVLLVASLGCSLISLLTYAVDKNAAHHGRWRVPEGTLHLWAILGGWPGALVAQRAFRHKTQKRSFQRAFRAGVGLNLLATVAALALPVSL